MKMTSSTDSIRLALALFFVLIASLVAIPLPAAAPQSSDPASIAGHWTGVLELPGQKIEFDVDFATKDGAWTGDISIPVQKAKDLPLTGITVQGGRVTFLIQGLPGDPTFKGEISTDGKKISGILSQGGGTFPFHMEQGIDPTRKVQAALTDFDKLAENALQALKVPGAAIAILKDNQVVYSKGFGFKDVENKTPVTPNTLFAIGSSSKAFTVFGLGKLVDDGKLDWDKPLRTYIPWFRLFDKDAGERLTPRDLVTHRSGLPRHDLVWYNNLTVTREELVRRLAFLQPSADLREKWQYNNLMFLTAGYLLETLTEKKWEDAVRSLVFEPLGMKRSNFSVLDSQKDNDFALPYDFENKAFKKIPFRDITTVGPAGSINSSAAEMSNWVSVHLADGKFGGKALLNPQIVADMHAPHMIMGSSDENLEILANSYGMGWFTDIYRGHRRVHHGGNIDGFSALVSFFPDDGLGFVVLTNMHATIFPELIIRSAVDRILGLEARDWIGDAVKRRTQAEDATKKAVEKKSTRKVPGTKLAHPLADYAGIYHHPGYGDIAIELKDNRLGFIYNGISTRLDHWHFETFSGVKITDPTFEDFKLSFRTDLNGRVAAATAAFEPTVEEIVFTKKPDPRQSDPAYLKKFEGRYDLMGQMLTVSLQGNVLIASIPGQPAYELQPDLGGEFILKQVKIISIRFIIDDKGAVSGIELIQPQGIFEGKRLK